MKPKSSWPYIGFIVIVVGLFVATIIAGNRPKLGLDLQGGVSVVLQPVITGKEREDDPEGQPRADQADHRAARQRHRRRRARRHRAGQDHRRADPRHQGPAGRARAGRQDRRAAVPPGPRRTSAPAPRKADARIGSTSCARSWTSPTACRRSRSYNDELVARGEPHDPRSERPTTTVPADGSTPTTTADHADHRSTGGPATTTAPAPAPAEPLGQGGQAPQPGRTTTVAPDDHRPPPAPPTTTTTIDPAPKNQFGIKVYKNAQGDLDARAPGARCSWRTRLRSRASVGRPRRPRTTSPSQEVILPGLAEEVDGRGSPATGSARPC